MIDVNQMWTDAHLLYSNNDSVLHERLIILAVTVILPSSIFQYFSPIF